MSFENEEESKDFRIFVGFVCFMILAILVGFLIESLTDDDTPDEPATAHGPYLVSTNPEVWGPMPCDEDEVFVWDAYPRTAECLSQDDHVGHARNEEVASSTTTTTATREPDDPTWPDRIQAMIDAEAALPPEELYARAVQRCKDQGGGNVTVAGGLMYRCVLGPDGYTLDYP